MQQRGPIAWQRRGLDGYRLKREVNRLQEDPTWHANNAGRVPDHGGSGVRMGVGRVGEYGVATSWRSGTWAVVGLNAGTPALGQGLRRQS